MTQRQHTEVLSTKEVAERLGCSLSHAYRLIADGALPSLDIGRNGRTKTRVPAKSVEAYIQAGLKQRENVTKPSKIGSLL